MNQPAQRRGLTRRRLAELSAAAGAGALLSGSWSASAWGGPTASYDDGNREVPRGRSGDPRRVIVIGAGFAGLAVANALRNAGVEVVVLEARRRIGGRADTRDLGDFQVDAGASWIHEPVGNPMTRFAEQAGVAQTSADIELDVATFTIYDEVRARQIPAPQFLRPFADGTRFGEMLGEYSDRLGPGSSIREAARAFFEDEGLTGDDRRHVEFVIRLIAEHTDNAFWHAIDLGASARYEPPYDGVGQGDFPVGGYRPIVAALAGTSEVRLGHRATAVERRRDGVRVKVYRRPRGGRAGRRYSINGSHVVVTVPLGVLKRDGIRFSPALPKRKSQAIRELGFGRFEKVSMLFGEPFWKEGGRTHIARINDRPPVAFSLFLDHEKLNGFPALTALGAGRYIQTIRGAGPRRREQLALQILDRVFGTQVPRPEAVVTTDWLGDRFSGGAYSFIRRGTHEQLLDVLAEPVGGRVLFAGEATSRARYGYTDGAMSSGIREAKRLLGRESVELSAG